MGVTTNGNGNSNDTTTMSTQKIQQKEIQQQLKQLRRTLQGCKEVDANSEAMAFAMRTIQQVEDSYKNGSRKITTITNGTNGNTSNDPNTNADVDAINNTKLTNANGHKHDDDGKGKKQQQKLSKKTTTTKKKKTTMLSKLKSILFTLIQFTLLELPLVAVFALLVFTTSFSHLYDEYLNPQLDLMTYTDHNRTLDQTYYHRRCTHEDMTAHTPDELLIKDDFTTNDCLEHMMVHGMSMYPQILKSSTASELRDWIIQRNDQIAPEDEIGVIANEHRWSFYIGATEHPTVMKALDEITHHPIFRPALESIVGPNPAIIEMTAITSEYGAEDQFWHPDVVPQGSAAKYAQSFIPSYALFVALQDITDKMGATEVCPGTYMCGEEADVCDGHGFQVSGHSKMGEYWHSGDAIFMNQQSYHRGPAHNDPKKGKRSLFIITFSPRPESMDVETRLLGQGGSYSLRKDMWGHTLADFEKASERMRWPWTLLRGLGLWKDGLGGVSNLIMGTKSKSSSSSSTQWGWDWITQNSMRIANTDTGYFQNQLIEFAVDGHYYKYLKFHYPNVFGSGFSLKFNLGSWANLLQMAPKVDEDMEWREYMDGTVEIWKTKMMQVNILAHAVFLIITGLVCVSLLSVQKIQRRRRGNGNKSELDSVSISVSPIKRAFKSIGRVAVLDGILIVVALLVLQRTADSNWAKEITSRTLYGSPFRVSSETLAEDILNGNGNGDVINRDLVVVSLADVLISERFDVKYLNMNGVNWLDFHEGNMNLRSKVKGVGASAMMGSTGTATSTDYSPHLASKDKQRLILSILDGTEREGSRFLKQNSNGDWIVAPQDYAYSYVSKLVHLESRALLAALEEEGRYILGTYKHGRKLNGNTLRMQSMKHIHGIMEALLENAGIPMSDLNLVGDTYEDDDDQLKIVTHAKLKAARSHSFGLKQMTSPIKSKSSINSFLPPRQKPSLPVGVMVSTELMGKLGDTVEVQYGGIHNEYYKGKIVKIREGSHIDIQYIDGEIDDGLAPKHLRKFEPYAKGEQVQCRTEYQEMYRNCIIDKVVTNDNAYIIFEGQRSRTRLAQKFIRRYNVGETFKVGDAVISPFQGSDELFKGIITEDNKDGTYNILFDDGDRDYHVPAFELERLD